MGPLHRCSIYGNKAAGEKLEKMLAMGASRPWPEALKLLPANGRWTPRQCWNTLRL